MDKALHILILEDNQTDAELTLFELEEAGFHVAATVVATEKDYIRELQKDCFDLILSDYDLPQYNGALALLEAARRCPDTPFILVSGFVTEDRAIEILTQGAKDYVLKNRLSQRLAPAVRRALAEADEQKARKKAEEELREAHKNLERQVNERTAELQMQLAHRRQIEATLLKYNEQLEIMSYITRQLLASDQPRQIVEGLCLKVMAFLDCQVFMNYIADDSTGGLHLNACAGIPSGRMHEIEWLESGMGVSGCAARGGCPLVAENIPEMPDVRSELIKSFGIKAYACHPLIEQNRVIGTLSFGTRTRTTFSAEDLAMMKAVADQVAIALHRVKMEDALRASESREKRRAGEMQALMDMAPVAIWIAHDPQCLRITGNCYADEIMQVPPDANVSVSAPPGGAALTYQVMRDGVELKPEELPAQIACATGRPVDPEMLDLVFSDGRVVRMIEGAVPLFDASGRVRGAVAAGADVTRLRTVEEELRRTTERFEMAQHAAEVGAWDWDILTGRIWWSGQMFHLFGLDPESVSASFEAWESIIHPEDREAAGLRIRQALQEHKILNSDYRIVLPGGPVRWINAVGEGQYDDRDRPVRMLGVCIDITGRKWAETALRESEQRLEFHFENSPLAVVEWNADFVVTRWSSEAERIFGWKKDEVIGRRIDTLNLIYEDDLLVVNGVVEGLVRGRASKVVSANRNCTKSGAVIECIWHNSVIVNAGGRMESVLSLVEDVTEQKRIEQAILLAKEEWERTFDTVPDLIAILDNQHRILRVNKAMSERLGVVPASCVGLHCHEAVHGMGQPPAFCPHSLTCGDGRQHIAEVHEPHLGGDFLVSTTPLNDREGRCIGSVHVARDITARRQAENLLARQTAMLQERTAQLESANQELESFSYSVSHDLRAPLRAIDGISRIILRQQGDQFDEQTRRQFEMIRDNTRMMGVLIDHLLSFSRVQKTGMKVESIDMDRTAREVWDEIRKAHPERALEFKMTGLPPGSGDQTLIRQVIFNLLDNAVKFTKYREPGFIEMGGDRESDKTIYWIRDNGAGFDMAYYDKLFGVFQRLHSVEEYEGTGVGLATVQRIINRHGGRVWAEGKENGGATFYFALPQN
ncbi:MAG: PAS domain S-box protein [Deltaproteobacteria bacterium]